MTLADRSPSSAVAKAILRSRWHGARMTLDEFLALPEEKPYLEYEDGVVKQKDVPSDVSPQGDHGSIQAEFVVRFDRAGRQRRLGKVFSETRFVTPGWSPVPDVSYYRRENIRPRSRHQIGDFHVPPDIAVEIVSPDQAVRELLEKCLRYATVGVPVSLIVDPDDVSIFVIRPNQQLVVLRGEDRIDLDDIIPGFELTVTELFASAVDDWLFEDGGTE
jgi:Uma2 family endonuclease